MWLVFVLILVGIVFNFQRKNGRLFKQPPVSESPLATTTPPLGPPATPPGQSGPVPTPPQKSSGPTLRLAAANAYAANPSAEYILLENIDYENKQKITISGFKLQNRDKLTATIGQDENGASITLDYGERTIIITGESPLGYNFKINKCSGYFNQRAAISPQIYAICPSVSSLSLPRNLNNACINYIESLPVCTMPTINADTGINNDCAEFVQAHASYAACVADYKNDKDFDKKEWRVYLGKNFDFWNNRHDLIQLFDPAGKLVTEISY
ncbi:MAG: hypothetical protein UX43_C0003G0154 [Candidatus Giovannonibacteria bacterium GW2011_GWB1_46_20]|nr:MAG: hypothetical protein UW15_C0024G0030 [Parcubacteria group bacterium GW2011_GWC1_44_10]KKT60214.1 MAG: hypothetical protein UW53_C0003G0125 [Candidatus Giovannonibacteria bacterium GW2011_GWA1_44_25]KKU30061.1 MAG: hypothetical protein UX43_C0003G0154 [Candidatus Giovannonibacteria bacterium GW2011_GWB1_46_20]